MFDSLMKVRKVNASLLKTQIMNHTLAHSLLLSGPPFSGKMSLAIEIARSLSCSKEGLERCDCPSCNSFRSMSMSNVIMLTDRDHEARIAASLALFEQMQTEHSKRLLIGQIRIALMAYHEAFVEKQDTKNSAIFALATDVDILLIDFEKSTIEESGILITQLKKLLSPLLQAKRPSVSIDNVRGSAKWTANTGLIQQHRFIILENIENSTVGANNSLLKLLEEPPLYTYVILLSNHPKRLLPTILSRVQHHELKPLSKEEKQTLFQEVFYADATHYSSIEEFVYSKGGVPLKELEKGAHSLIESIATRRVLETALLNPILMTVDSSLSLRFFLDKLHYALRDQLLQNKMSVREIEKIGAHINESVNKAKIYNQQTPVLLETLYYRLVSMI